MCIRDRIRTDGRVEGTGDGLTVRDAEEAVLYLAVKTSFRGYDQLPLPGDGEMCIRDRYGSDPGR